MEQADDEYAGQVIAGVIVLENNAALPEGTRVRVVPLAREQTPATPGQIFLKYAGAAQGLPSDFAENHDHYLHGTPKNEDRVC